METQTHKKTLMFYFVLKQVHLFIFKFVHYFIMELSFFIFNIGSRSYSLRKSRPLYVIEMSHLSFFEMWENIEKFVKQYESRILSIFPNFALL